MDKLAFGFSWGDAVLVSSEWQLRTLRQEMVIKLRGQAYPSSSFSALCKRSASPNPITDMLGEVGGKDSVLNQLDILKTGLQQNTVQHTT